MITTGTARAIRALASLALIATFLFGGIGGANAADEEPGPPRDRQLPVRVFVAMRILDVAQVQETLGQMNARVELSYRWNDPRLSFDRIKAGVTRQDFFDAAAKQQFQKIWTPAMAIENLVGSPREDQIGLSISANGDILLVRTIGADFRLATDMSTFPFDRQRLMVQVVSTQYSLHDVILVHTEEDDMLSGITRTPLTPLWALKRLDFIGSNYVAWNGDSYSRMTIVLVADRKWAIYLSRLFLPFLLIVSISLFVLWSDEYNPASNGPQIFSGMLALVALIFTFEAEFPGSMSADTPIATMVSSGFVYLIATLAAYVGLMNPSASWAEKHPHLFAEVRTVIRWALPLLAAIFWTSMVATAAV